MLVKDVMSRRPEIVAPGETVAAAARKMRAAGVGVLPVCEGDRLVGMLTDRDIVVRAVAAGEDPRSLRVSAAMTPQVVSCSEGEDLEAAAALMDEHAVRRMAVLGAGGALVGVLSVDDLATFSRALAGEVIEHSRDPGRPLERGGYPWWEEEEVR
ncbi:CBS domain-containing protein [Anaeromyxobacter diazotrophicus]|uniref:Inosine-5-monophosphate dehydrogenase n=1 Tax=Anaeromyxobacter diazotrophicus TaxID=2590199 RepID=A0A7I9VLP1_9BACT|nr:CBS domain-containing protein [Anaeromyxobacter diazotrophicus]GEJ57118.1 inosine-5-monophosphate dehydrogenase [Anaeromyxobacter diazotrophicus]